MTKSEPRFSPDSLAVELAGPLGLAAGDAVCVAYSGGLDSHVLLHALSGLRAATGLMLRAVHVDHGLHPQSAAWAAHCRQVCAALAVPCRVERVQVARDGGDGLEAAARRARYAALAAGLGAGETLLTAHQRDDQAETLLLQLFRGAGVQGLKAMPASQAFGAGRLARPLLDYSRASLREYAQAQGLRWIDDSSNVDTALSRNFLRHQVLPDVRRRWPGVDAALARSARHAAEAAALLDALAEADLAVCRHAAVCGHGLSVPALRALDPARRRNLLRYWLRRQGFHLPQTRHLAEVDAMLMHDPAGRRARVAWPGAELWRYRDTLCAMPPRPRPDPSWARAWDLDAPLAIADSGDWLEAGSASGAGIARARIAPAGVVVRLRQGGERCRLPGRAHHHQLKKLLQARGVPPWERDWLPLVYQGDALVAVADLWVCEPFAARPGEPAWQLRWRRVAAETPLNYATGDTGITGEEK
ncbi:MAG TPA: tRNA lysidine(34) synthetase TilS [Acidiferrobacterales bacterium]